MSRANLLDVLLESSHDFIYFKDKDSKFIKLNEKAAWALGVNCVEDAIGKSDFDFFPDIAERTRADEIAIMESGNPQINEAIEIIFADGSKHWVSTSKVPFYDQQGNVKGIVGISRDITEQKQKDEELKIEKERLQTLLETFPGFVYLQSPDYTIKYANGFFKDIFSDPGEKPCYEILHKRSEPCENCPTFKVFQSKIPQKWEWNEAPNGKKYLIYDYPFQDSDGSQLVLEIGVDITEKKKVEDELKKKEEKIRKKNIDLKLAQKIAMVGNWTLDPEVGVPEWSDMIYEIYERDPDKGPIPVKEYEKLYQGKDWETFHNAITNASQKGIAYEIELQPKLPSGKKKWIRAICEPEKQSKNSNYFLRGTIQDITKEKENEILLSKTLEATTDGIWMWNFKENAMFFSDRYYQMLGYEPQEFEANYENWLKLIHTDDKQKAIAVAEEYLMHKPDVYENSFRLKTKQGTYRWIRSKARVVERDANGEAIRMIGNHEDITERKNAEEQLQYAYDRYQRLAENVPGVIYQYKQNPKNNTDEFTYVSPAVNEMFGLTPSAIEEDSNLMWESVHADDLQDFSQSVEESQKKLKPWNKEFRIQLSDGNIKWLKGVSKPKKQSDGSILWEGLLIDITKTKQIEQSIKESEEKFKLLFENSISGVVICKLIKDNNGNPIDYIHLHANPACEKHLEAKLEHLINKKATELIGDEAGLLYAQKNGITVITGKPQTWVHFTPEPYNRYLRMDSYFIKDDLFAIVFENITEKLEKEKQLMESQERYTLAMNATKDGLFDWNLLTNEIYYSPGWKKMLGYEYDELPNDFSVWETLTDPEDVKKSWTMQNELINKKRDRFEIEFKMKHKDGHWVDILSRAEAVFNEEGRAIRIIGTHVDISEKKNVENLLRERKRELEESEKKLSNIFENRGTACGIFGEEGLISLCNTRFEELTGFSKDEIIGKMKWSDFVLKEDLERMNDYHKRRSNGKPAPHEYECTIIDKHKNKHIVIINIGLIPETKERIVSLTDMTNLRKAEETINTLFRMSTDLICKADLNTATFTSINPAFKTILGYNEEELLSHSFIDFIHPDDKERTQRVIDEQLQNGDHVISFVNRYRCKDGSYIWLDWNSYPRPDEGFTYAIARNITEKMQMQEELMESQERYRSLFEDSHDWVFIHDFKGNFIDANSTALNGMGYNKNELQNLNFSKIIDKRDLFKALNETRKLVKNGNQKDDVLRYRVKRKDGSLAVLETVSSLLYKDGVPYAVQGIARDITDKIIAEEKIVASEEKYRNIVNLAPDGIITMDLKGYITSMNHAFSSLTGYSEEEIVGKHFTKLPTMSGIDMTQYLPLIKMVLLGGEAKTIDFEWRNKQGELRFGQAKMSMMKLKGEKNNIQAIIRDTTEEKRAEEKLKQAHQELKNVNTNLEGKVDERTKEIQRILDQKDEFINQLGHDLKNPLGPLVNLLPILEQNETDSKNKEILKVINRNVSYMKNLVTKTIQLAQLRSPNCELRLENVNLNDEINEILETNKFMFEENHIEIEKNLEQDIWINIDRLRFHEVFNNILNNAIKYSQNENGKIIIDQKKTEEDFIEIIIKDNGVGMTSDQLEKIFDEFFKADQSRHDFDSSGLGMPITKRIIEMHGGRIWAESEGLGKGSTFHFTLPLKNLKN